MTDNEDACFFPSAAYPRENGIQVHPIRFERDALVVAATALYVGRGRWVGQPRRGFTV